ncbi:MAG TPA: hypothetical protein VGL57_07580 [Solirubrobacteraceae bacterium]
MALGALALSLLLASSALAKPKGPFEVFAQCPTATATTCFYMSATGGEIHLNKDTVPLTKTVKIQGGIKRNTETGAETFIGALNGETLSKTPQALPGGLLGLLTCREISNPIEKRACEVEFEGGQTAVNLTAELAKPASEIGVSKVNFFKEEGVALQLPVKLKLENPFLGSECYIGSAANPVVWPLTTGTTKPPPPYKSIKGTAGKVEILEEGKLEKAVGASLVENAFKVPGASGCGGIYSFLIDPILDEKIGLPATAGMSTVILNGTVEFATAKAVVESE